MKICIIYDLRGDCPVFASVNPNKSVFIRELSLAVKNDKSLIYGLYPEDYCLIECTCSPSIGPVSQAVSADSVVPFTDFIEKEDVSNGSEEN